MEESVSKYFSTPTQTRIAQDILITLNFIPHFNPQYSSGIVPVNVLHCRITSEVESDVELYWYLMRLQNGQFVTIASAQYDDEITNMPAVRFNQNGYKFIRGEIS